MNPLLQLFRIGNAVMGIVGLLMGVLIAAGTGILDHWQPVAFAAVAVFSFIAGGNSLNDYTDREVDKLAHPERPLHSNLIQQAYPVATIQRAIRDLRRLGMSS